MERYDDSEPAFNAASDTGLIRISELEQIELAIDQLGEQRAATVLTDVERASRAPTLDLLAVLAGLILFGLLLAYLVAHTASDIRVLYAEQQRTSDQLEQALQAKNDFIADASHELRTPLTVLRGNAEVG